MADTKEANKALGDALASLKQMKRFELNWEWMAEAKNGEYVKFEDVHAYLLAQLKRSN